MGTTENAEDTEKIKSIWHEEHEERQKITMAGEWPASGEDSANPPEIVLR